MGKTVKAISFTVFGAVGRAFSRDFGLLEGTGLEAALERWAFRGERGGSRLICPIRGQPMKI